MLVTTTFDVPGRRTLEILGVCKGTTIRARHLGRSILAWFRSLVGGEITDYTKVIAEARDQAYDRMVDDATKMGADAILGMRFSSSEVMSGAAEIVVYGTAVVLEESRKPTE